MGQPRHLFVQFRSYQMQFYSQFVVLSEIRTRIVRVEGEHADHLTTTTAHAYIFLQSKRKFFYKMLKNKMFDSQIQTDQNFYLKCSN